MSTSVLAADKASVESRTIGTRIRDAAVMAFVATVKTAVVRGPRSAIAPTARSMAFLHRNFVLRERRILSDNLERILGIEPGSDEMRRMRRRISVNQAAGVLETIRAIHRPGTAQISGLEELRRESRRIETRRGQILVTAHLGSWELLGACMAQVVSTRFVSLAKRSPVAPFARFLSELRAAAGTGELWIGRKSMLREMLTVLRRGGWLGLAMDQKPEGRGPEVEFFGRPTRFVVGPASLAIRTGCPVLAAFCLREGPFRYRLTCRTVLEPEHAESDPDALTQRLASVLEEEIRRNVTQWPWTYRRWRFAGDPKPR